MDKGETNKPAKKMTELMVTGYVDFNFHKLPDLGRFSIAFGLEEAAGRIVEYDVGHTHARHIFPLKWIIFERKWE